MFEKVFFVLLLNHHGATLLAKLINAHPDLTALGDTYPSNAFDQVCGCGERVSTYLFWQAVKADVGAERHPDARVMLPQYPGDRGRAVGRFAFSDFSSYWATPEVLRRTHQNHLLAFREDYEAFLAAVHRHTSNPGRIFVDGLKFNSRVSALVASGFPVDGVIHLHRDPVDFVHSSMRNTGKAGARGLFEHALRYRLDHARARRVFRTVPALSLHYETLAVDIDGQPARLFRFLGTQPMTVGELRQWFDQEWHFMGNSSLFGFNGLIGHRKAVFESRNNSVIHFLARRSAGK
ncbi:sulfotransferase [Spiribacter sp. 1M153]|uniref:sulfotransferase n=1 Tax=Spiribacter roseus TaxID=1855875 RepID=UPI00349F6F65